MTVAVDGLVLCRVGDGRLAVDCAEVDAITAPEAGSWNVAAVFEGIIGTSQKALQCSGHLLAVDSLDIVTTPGLRVLAAPALVMSASNGAVKGFVEWSGLLWPLVSVGPLLDFLEHRGSR